MFELYFPKSPRDCVSILCFLLCQKVSSLLLLFVLSLELSHSVRGIRKTWANTKLEFTNILAVVTTGDVTDQPWECEECAGVRRHDVGLRSDNWIMTPDSRSNTLVTQQLGAPSPLLCGYLPPSKEPRSAHSVSHHRLKKMQLTPRPGPDEVTCPQAASRHVTAHIRGSSG